MLAQFLQFLFSGITVGVNYALDALGFTLIYNASNVINFAQGEFIMLGGMLVVYFSQAGLPMPLALVLAIVLPAVVGGLGNGLGAVLGGLLVGILEAMGAGNISSSYKDAIPFVLILLILFFKPRGLFGGIATDRV
ncbi:MAG: hypothetical protein AUK51_01630 [Comamonadaceae bacterium CG2_30_59_20]|nr:MAG: hypothetical protein AUK51_01630 [Comamonadaceae bacterium CG2_30_59_20]